MKWMSRYTATGKVMVKRKARQSATCPRCHHPDEDMLHVLTYPSISPISLRKSLLSELRIWMRDNQTHPRIVHFIYKGLTKWLKIHHISGERIARFIEMNLISTRHPHHK